MSEPLPPTEQRNPASRRLADLDAHAVISLMSSEEHRVLSAVEKATPLLALAAQRVASSCISEGERSSSERERAAALHFRKLLSCRDLRRTG